MIHRPRRLRQSEMIRSLVRETKVTVDDLIYPLFVVEGSNIKKEISSLQGNYHFSIDQLEDEIKEIVALGIKGVLLFGLPAYKDDIGSGAYDDEGIVQKATRKIKSITKDLLVITDVCLCEYTNHGHCGVIKEDDVDNDLSVELVVKTALSHAKAGADIVAPSDMMDGRVGAIREKLDEKGYSHVPIMAYSVKYASAFYGPFREAAGSAPQFGDRRGYQMDPANRNEAIREVVLDTQEGADMVMVKPALPYLDIIREVRNTSKLPVVAYNVSGEYAMVKAAAEKGWIDGDNAMDEMLLSIKRAGADIIITYFAKDFARGNRNY